MGKTGRWFRSLLGGKKTAGDTAKPPAKEKKRWGFVKSFRDRDRPAPMAAAASGQDDEAGKKGSHREVPYSSFYGDESAAVDPNKHAIAVAAATAAVAEAAVAAAQAAAAVVKLTSSGRCASAVYGGRRRDEWAALKIQAAFRGYLARRALRALKGLVKLQALVRGHIVRKQAAETMRCMQALVRVQARVRAGRIRASESRHVGIGSQSLLVPVTPEKHELLIHANSTKICRPGTLKRNASKPSSRGMMDHDKEHSSRNCLDHWMDERLSDHPETVIWSGGADDEKNDKILEVDMGKPSLNSKRRNINHHNSQSSTRNSQSLGALPDSPSKDTTTAQLSAPSPSSAEVQSLTPLKYTIEVDESLVFDTAENSPQFYSASSRPGSSHWGAFTPTERECSRSFFSGYSDHPNYMSNTESSRAKVRSQSAPKQRPEFEKSSSMKKFSPHGFADARVQVQSAQRSSSSLQARFASKAYPGSGRLDRLGMPIREAVGHGSINRSKW